MAHLSHVPVGAFALDRFESLLHPGAYEELVEAQERAADILHGRVVWNVNSTAKGGGVAEMLQSLLAYSRGAGIDARWVVIDGNDDFFRVTKRIHNHLHGAPGDGGPLGRAERDAYESTLESNADELTELIEPDDVVILHDPQTAGLIPPVRTTDAAIIWRCHVGLDRPTELSRHAWDFLREDVAQANAFVFSREAFAWEGLDTARVRVIPPSIDAFSPKNQGLEQHVVEAILARANLLGGDTEGDRTFLREDGSPGRVDREAEKFEGAPPPPPADARIVAQVSRWDRLKDPVGVIRSFAAQVAPTSDAHLVMAGPAVQAVADDPEGLEVLNESRRAWEGLETDARERIHLVALPMLDAQENAAIVNALQRRSQVVVQKSLAEGFGLTVAEAMWKARPVVASRIGGIQDQIADGRSGVLLDDPTDPQEFGAAVLGLLGDPESARRMGDEAQARVRADFLPSRHLGQWVQLIASVLDGRRA